ncbi:MAG: hypothetical protein LBT86_06015 [Deltaproteobacteria bacterium]|nr:hypothetical protein [Deltaproteobacteria bacterium]
MRHYGRSTLFCGPNDDLAEENFNLAKENLVDEAKPERERLLIDRKIEKDKRKKVGPQKPL